MLCCQLRSQFLCSEVCPSLLDDRAIWGYFTSYLLLQYQNNVCSYHNTVCCYLVTIVLTVAAILCVQEPGYETGDVVIVLDEVDHRVFKRKGADLLMELVRTLHNLNCDYQSGSY